MVNIRRVIDYGGFTDCDEVHVVLHDLVLDEIARTIDSTKVSK